MSARISDASCFSVSFPQIATRPSGDVFNVADLEKAVKGCDAVHISLASADDVKAVAIDVLLHRLVLTSEAKMKKDDARGILQSLILKVKVPA